MSNDLMANLREIWRLQSATLSAQMIYLKTGAEAAYQRYRQVRRQWLDAEKRNSEILESK